MDLSQVSRTAILTLICRAVEAGKDGSGFNDPMAILCLERLISTASDEDRRWITSKQRMYSGLHERDAKAGARRAQAFDQIANRFIAENPNCTVINLACGFDTRFWRIESGKCSYIELDLPEVINLKKKLLEDQPACEQIGASVLDTAWIDQVTTNGNTHFLLIAEGLFDWLLQQDAVRLLKEIGARFSLSQLVLDKIPGKYTQGIWKTLMRWHSRIEWGLDVAWVSGIRIPQDLEACGEALKVIGQEKGSAGPIFTISIGSNRRI